MQIAELREQLGDDAVRAIADDYTANCSELLGVIGDPGNSAEIRMEAAHSLKGSSGSMGLAAVAQLCHEAERAFREGRLDAAEDIAARLPPAVEEAHAALLTRLAP